ncbi:MAG: hypothetical protein KBB83_02150 [Alphaproteobacteria bacterium]|nr:hypothetical protein [Alphaproteobacteria bacterium]
MFIGKMLKAMVESVFYPLKNFIGLVVPFIMTLAMFVIVGLTAIHFNLDAMIAGSFGDSHMAILINLGLLFLLVLVLAPLIVSIIRHVVVSEKMDAFVLKHLFSGRELKLVMSIALLFAILFLPLLVTMVVLHVMFIPPGCTETMSCMGNMSMSMLLFGSLLVLGALYGFYMFSRGIFVLVEDALDRDGGFRRSFKMTKGHGLALMLGFMVFSYIMIFVLLKVMVLLGITFSASDLQSLHAMSLWDKTLLITIILSVRLFFTVIVVAFIAKVYVLLAGR